MPVSRFSLAGCVLCLFLSVTSGPAFALGWFGKTLDGSACKGGGQGFGPWDFFDVDEKSDPAYHDGRWWEARNLHGKPGLAALNERPMTQVSYNRAAGEFDYILRAYPNHPEILSALIELEMRRRQADRRITRYRTPPECYLLRAAVYRPKQPHVRQLHGFYMHRLGRYEDAIARYAEALGIDADLSEVHYNMGLAYLSLSDYEQALSSAHAAYRLGYPLPGLKRKLMREGHWREPTAQSTETELQDVAATAEQLDDTTPQ